MRIQAHAIHSAAQDFAKQIMGCVAHEEDAVGHLAVSSLPSMKRCVRRRASASEHGSGGDFM
jgi:hypothetical protein